MSQGAARRPLAALVVAGIIALPSLAVIVVRGYYDHPAPIVATAVPPAQVVPIERAPARIASRAARSTARTTIPKPRRRAFLWPVAGSITSPFGPRGTGFHHGVDIGCAIGTPIRASYPGRVAYVGETGGAYGTAIVVDHGGSYQTLYAHLSEVSVAPGQAVGQLAVIGRCGDTGKATGPHLHFELRYNGYVWDPVETLQS